VKFLLLILILTASTSALTLKVSDISGRVGEDISVPIKVENATNLGSLDIVVSYNTDILKFKSVGKGGLNKGLISSNVNEQDGIIAIAIADSRGITGSGEVAVMTFTPLKQGSSDIAFLGAKAYDVNTHLEISTELQHGKVTIGTKSAAAPGFESIFAIIALLIIALRRKT